MTNSHTYRRAQRRLTRDWQILQSNLRLNGSQKRAIVYFLEVSTVDETRRARRAESTEREDITPKVSVTY